VVESASLLRRYMGNCIEGSNPSLSASYINNLINYFLYIKRTIFF
jgi:hypothetical protein